MRLASGSVFMPCHWLDRIHLNTTARMAPFKVGGDGVLLLNELTGPVPMLTSGCVAMASHHRPTRFGMRRLATRFGSRPMRPASGPDDIILDF
ncbi:hypothetical protein R1sor_026522 [Riccia sorocarpa]|uniref:Uncharacterized protein n=1 Tax=Riccia sorocarpa TaxID=122646 RepID=A0ABD3GDP7_9MARC